MERIIRHDDQSQALMEYRSCLFEDQTDLLESLTSEIDWWKAYSTLDTYLTHKYQYLVKLFKGENMEFDVWMFANKISNFYWELAEADFK